MVVSGFVCCWILSVVFGLMVFIVMVGFEFCFVVALLEWCVGSALGLGCWYSVRGSWFDLPVILFVVVVVRVIAF